MRYEYKGNSIPTEQSSLAGDVISEEEKQRKANNAKMRKKYRLMSVALIAVIIFSVVLIVVNRNSNAPESNQLASPKETNSITDSQEPTINELTISKSSLYFTRVGDYSELAANHADVQWSTNAPNIVSVSETGRVTALNGGIAEVYAKHNGTTKVCTVTVNTHVPTEDEIVEANRQIKIVEDYEAQYTTYSYSEVQAMYDDFINAGNTVTPHSYPGTTIKRLDKAKVVCYYADWYYNLSVYYYDSSNAIVYRDEYTVVTNGSIDTSNPTYSDWIVSSVFNQLFSIDTDKARYYCYHNPNGGAFSWLLYEADYIDAIASRTIITAEYLS